MSTKKKITEAIFEAIDEVNQILPGQKKIGKSLDSELYGLNGMLDSLELVNLIVAVEQYVEDSFGTPIILADQRAMSQR